MIIPNIHFIEPLMGYIVFGIVGRAVSEEVHGHSVTKGLKAKN